MLPACADVPDFRDQFREGKLRFGLGLRHGSVHLAELGGGGDLLLRGREVLPRGLQLRGQLFDFLLQFGDAFILVVVSGGFLDFLFDLDDVLTVTRL